MLGRDRQGESSIYGPANLQGIFEAPFDGISHIYVLLLIGPADCRTEAIASHFSSTADLT